CSAEGVEALLPEAVMAPQALQLPSLRMGNEWYGIGSGWTLAESMSATTLALVSQRNATAEPAAEEMVLLAARNYAQGIRPMAHESQPIYLRDQVAWQKGA
ncbi:MAG: tRNA (adenosine(37)-N6)-threonylcarbamoyltransferase complex dimerization subunit type 1 TsaB, partial [Halomonadaceae bacterium]|nr:tRNA (adenosine(37)-N6)-threonylcarbamoyltransferase complex dimerization subunit type 1 TsaB [Halomonadaceae bacterium]